MTVRALKKSVHSALETYRAKRDFKLTPEPSGSEPITPKGEGYFVVQKHLASHLHYDFRLALGGVLKSWAVAKGPSRDPHDKRLAVQVEDHPVGYGDFEGIIPKGQYGGGTVMVWDHGTWEPLGDAKKDLAAGHMKFRLNGTRLKGDWVLVRMGGNAANERKPNWLLIKERDDEAHDGGVPLTESEMTSAISGRTMDEIAGQRDRVWQSKGASAAAPVGAKKAVKPKAPRGKKALPDFVPPQLATRVKAPPAGADWLHEIKFDGYRVLARIAGGEVQMLTRRGNDWTLRFQAVASNLAKLNCSQALVDGEVVVLGENGVSDFGRLQATLAGEARYPMTFQAFDMLHLDGEDLTGLKLVERKSLLQKLLAGLGKQQTIQYSDHIESLGEKFFAHACQMALEGVISKRRDAPYRSGRTDSWVKSKCVERQEFVIGGYSKSTEPGKGLRSLLLGYYDKGKLRYAGRVGTGFTQASSRTIRTALDKLVRKTLPFEKRPECKVSDVIWVEPQAVCEVEFMTWTSDGLLRHASFKGMREDKPATEITIERPVSTAPSGRGKLAMPTAKAKSEAKAADDLLSKMVMTHPERVLDAESGLTKRGLAEYLALVADRMMPHIVDRPLSFVRCPGGTGKACFYQKHSEAALPPGIGSVHIRDKSGSDDYLTIETAEGLIGLAQMGVLEIHPWGSRADDVEKPDRLIFDFDPDPAVPFAWVVEAALAMRERLAKLDLESFLKTTGGKGLHVVAPIARKHEWPVIKEFARAVSTATAAESDRYVVTMTKAKRTGKIFIDFFRNDRGATAVAPYSTRARPGATVAVPLDWREADASLSPAHFTVETMPRRLAQLKADPWEKMLTLKQKLSDAALKSLKVST